MNQAAVALERVTPTDALACRLHWLLQSTQAEEE